MAGFRMDDDEFHRLECSSASQPAESVLGRMANPTVYTLANWRWKRKEENTHVLTVAAQPKVSLHGTEDD
ncbi:MAG: hypothetical protein ABI619_07480 [Betaproteobacteria bacterium]